MNRRNCLSSLGLSAAGSVVGLAAVTATNERPWVLSLESFRVSNAERLRRLHSYLGGAFLSYLARVHRGPKMVLEAIVAPHTPQALVVTAFQSFDEMIEIRNKVAAHSGIQRARGSGMRRIADPANRSRYSPIRQESRPKAKRPLRTPLLSCASLA